jgi:glycosyltransferase involved in cell wall biosynthesis
MFSDASSKPLDLSLIIPVHNADRYFRDCLEAIQQSRTPPHELIVVADGEPDETCRLAERFGARVIRTASPQGPARARNLGANAAQGELLFFIDADVLIKRDTIRQVQTFFVAHPEYDAMIGSYDDTPGQANFLSQYKNMTNHFVHQHSLEEATTFWGACGAIRRSVFLEAGGFDESYRTPSIEDIEFGYRLKGAGRRIFLNKSIQVTHLKRWETGSLLRADIFQRAVPWSRLLLTMKSMPRDLNLSMGNRLSVVLVFLSILLGAASFFMPWSSLGAGLCLIPLGIINRKFYAFFLRRKGVLFTAASLIWHWFSFFYSGVAFGWIWAMHIIHTVASPPSNTEVRSTP